ncbi:A/G-specific adenine glycosylase [Arcanobacterium pluranimalium]|uniref:A/G-specific adenine glycosylase n=1 Tax=Arcanobacterium pluranimalium TaxID=108028 RepID=UPI0023BADFD1|nr:A/G-specific adenine glycosylase [Arcanobacterium pluranimalium]MBM7825920.1 A/G-specific adenine glycosylase [Arcanobacterium pluranimalium]
MPYSTPIGTSLRVKYDQEWDLHEAKPSRAGGKLGHTRGKPSRAGGKLGRFSGTLNLMATNNPAWAHSSNSARRAPSRRAPASSSNSADQPSATSRPALWAAEQYQQILLPWYEQNGRDLPWRHPQITPWAIVVCEVMSQQTPVNRVLPAWAQWMERWPTPADLAAASPAEVLIAWDRLGYPRRALRLHECAQVLVRDYDGALPHTRQELLALPGIGAYTADAVLAFAYQQYSVVLDTNIRRVLARWHGAALPPPSQTVFERERACVFVPQDATHAAHWNAAIMEFGALVCTARDPRCKNCPVQNGCLWFQEGKPADSYAHQRTTQKFTGTHREARGKIMAVLRSRSHVSKTQLFEHSGLSQERFESALASLKDDGLLTATDEVYSLPALP